MSSIEWKISTLSDRRLESEISNIYYRRHYASVDAPEEGVLGKLWAEFDRRVAAGMMTDDDEGLLNDTRKY